MFWQHYPDSTDVFVGISFNPKQDKTGQHHITIACYQLYKKVYRSEKTLYQPEISQKS